MRTLKVVSACVCGYECVCVWWDVPVFLNEHNVFEWLLIHITISYLYCMYSGRRNYNLVKTNLMLQDQQYVY